MLPGEWLGFLIYFYLKFFFESLFEAYKIYSASFIPLKKPSQQKRERWTNKAINTYVNECYYLTKYDFVITVTNILI